jgi:hypothetical protein
MAIDLEPRRLAVVDDQFGKRSAAMLQRRHRAFSVMVGPIFRIAAMGFSVLEE